MDCNGRPRAEGSAACVETTAYALLALRQVEGEDQFTVCLAQWLIRIRGDSGGFYSSQVCPRGVGSGQIYCMAEVYPSMIGLC